MICACRKIVKDTSLGSCIICCVGVEAVAALTVSLIAVSVAAIVASAALLATTLYAFICLILLLAFLLFLNSLYDIFPHGAPPYPVFIPRVYALRVIFVTAVSP